MSNKLRMKRLEAGLTQQKLSEKTGVSRYTIVMLEKNSDRNTKLSTLRKIATALGTTVQDLFF